MTLNNCSKAILSALMILVALLGVTATAHADFGIKPGSLRVAILDADGNVEATPPAGGHPFVQEVAFSLNTKPNPFPNSGPGEIPDDQVKNVITELPPGLVGSPDSIPSCDMAEFVPQELGGYPNCPTASQVGVAEIDIGFAAGYHEPLKIPVYNLAPAPGVAATFGFVPLIPITVDLTVRTGGDYGVTATVRNTSQAVNLYSSVLRIWGVPSDSRHDAERYLPKAFFPGDGHGNGLPSGLIPRPFLDNPAQCGVARSTRLTVDSWQNPETQLSYDSDPLEFTGCEAMTFKPSVKVTPDAHRAGSPAGLGVDIFLPQSDNPNGRMTPPVKDVDVTFPEGTTVNSASANGLTGCTPDQIALKGPNPATCPDSSRIGSVEIKSPLLGHPLDGGVYVATQGTNPFNSLLALYISVVDPETGVVIKVPGKVSLDPDTGQLTSTFEDNPQLPFEKLHMQLQGGPNAPIVLPAACGTYTTQAELTSWAQPDSPVASTSSFKVDEGCDAASSFDPKLSAGTTNPIAGESSPFVLRITREDGEQNLSRIETTLPKGVLAKLAGVEICDGAAASSGNCPAASQVGTTSIGSGAGSNPVYVPQPGKAPTAVYLAGAYKGAPYSLVVKVPAQAGPFDLGTVTVRNGLYIDPVSTQVTVKSDPLPQILEGIPIGYRDVRVNVDRPDFTINPTSCAAQQVTSVLTSAAGKTATPSDRFQVTNCAALGFKPKLALKFSGPTHRSAHPKLKATLTMPKGGANIAKAVVTLPKTEFLENAHIRTICTRVQYAADQCPKASVYGYAKAWSPLLHEPLRGPVYLRSSSHTLPDLVASLDGQIHVDLAGRIDSPGGKIRNTFWAVPDAPVSKFVLTMQGGDKGLLVNNEELCRAKPRARAEFTGQNGKRSVSRPLVNLGCGKASRKR